jgi:hypothetical protein
VVSDLARDPRSAQPWNPEPLAGNYNECARLSAVVIKANSNADNATIRAVMFHLGKYIQQGVPDTFGFNGIDASRTTGDTVVLTYPSGCCPRRLCRPRQCRLHCCCWRRRR